MLFRVWREIRAAHPEMPLGDGSVPIVEGVTSGTNQVLQLGSPHWTRLKRLLPAKWRRLTGEPLPPRTLHADPPPHLWLFRRSIAGGAYLPFPPLELGSVNPDG